MTAPNDSCVPTDKDQTEATDEIDNAIAQGEARTAEYLKAEQMLRNELGHLHIHSGAARERFDDLLLCLSDMLGAIEDIHRAQIAAITGGQS